MIRALLFGLLLALGACKAPPEPQPRAQDADPALWVVRDADTTIYLFGTVHLMKPGLTWFDEGVRKAFDASDTLMLELVMPPEDEMQALIAELGTAKAGPPLPAQLPPAVAARLRDALSGLGLAPDALDRDEPWLAAVSLSVLPLRQLGYDDKDGAEQVLSAAARAAGKPIEGLETARQQFGYFDTLSMPAQRQLLATTLDDLPKMGAEIETMVKDWSAGDADALAKLLNEDLDRTPELKQALLVTRNRNWANWIAARMQKPGTVFVAVGAGHLAGADSVQAELAKRGLEAERVRY